MRAVYINKQVVFIIKEPPTWILSCINNQLPTWKLVHVLASQGWYMSIVDRELSPIKFMHAS